jgi:hypothetical protein
LTKIDELYKENKLYPSAFNSEATFRNFVINKLGIEEREVNEIFANPTIRNFSQCNNSFVYQSKQSQERINIEVELGKSKIRCDLCKHYGHLSHTCSIKNVLNLILTINCLPLLF